MKREILFRGMRKDTKEWVHGNLVNWHPNLNPRIIYFEMDFSGNGDGMKETNFEVISETVGQFTGLADKNGTKIFEGDVLTHTVVVDSKRKGEIHSNHVDFYEYYWRIGNGSFRRQLTKNWIYNQSAVVTGNIHETPEKP